MPKVKDCKKSMFVERAISHAARAMRWAETASTSPLAETWAEAAKDAAEDAVFAAIQSAEMATNVSAYMAEGFAKASLDAAKYASSQSHKVAAGVVVGNPPARNVRPPPIHW